MTDLVFFKLYEFYNIPYCVIYCAHQQSAILVRASLYYCCCAYFADKTDPNDPITPTLNPFESKSQTTELTGMNKIVYNRYLIYY